MEGLIAGLSLFEQVAVMREVDLYHLWAPFCNKSEKITALGGKLDQIGWFETGGVGMVRDSCYRAIGCDCMMESGEVVVVAQGLDDGNIDGNVDATSASADVDANDNTNEDANEDVNANANAVGGQRDEGMSSSSNDSLHADDEAAQHRHGQIHLNDNSHDNDSYKNNHNNNNTNHNNNKSSNQEFIPNFLAREEILHSINLPPRPKGFNKDRMQLKFFEAVLHVHSPTTATAHLVANLDLKLTLVPQFIIDFIMKHMCGLLLVKMQAAARKAMDYPATSPHAVRMRDDNFYKNWLLPKFVSYTGMQGWEMPEVNALKDDYYDSDKKELDGHGDDGNGNGNDDDAGVENGYGDIRRVFSADDASQSSRKTIGSRLRSAKLNLKTKRTRSTSSSSHFSVQSAPVLSHHQHGSARPLFSSVKETRLAELKAYRDQFGKEPTAMKEMRTSITRPLGRIANMGRVDHILNDCSHFVVLPLLFLAQLNIYYAVNYDPQFVGDFWVVRRVLVGLLILFVFGWIHWKIIETLLVSTFDTIDLPVPKFTGNNRSSSTRQYFIQQGRLSAAVFSVSLALMAIGKGVLTFLLRCAVTLGNWFVAAIATRGLEAAESSDACLIPIWSQIVNDTRTMMIHSSVFIAICCCIAMLNYPSRAGKPVKITRRPGNNPEGEGSRVGLEPIHEDPASPLSASSNASLLDIGITHSI